MRTCVPYCDIIGLVENTNLEEEINQNLRYSSTFKCINSSSKKGEKICCTWIYSEKNFFNTHCYGWSVFRFKSITFLPIIDFKIRQMEVSLRRRSFYDETFSKEEYIRVRKRVAHMSRIVHKQWCKIKIPFPNHFKDLRLKEIKLKKWN